MTTSENDRTRRFDALFAAHGPDVVAYCGWGAAHPDDAQDAVAEVFLVAWRRLDEVPRGDAARVWLYATARRVIANQRRAGRRRVALRERLAEESARQTPGREDAGPDRDEALVREALDMLRPPDREVLLLAEREGLTPEQIGAVLGCLAVTARGRLYRARRRFRAIFDALRTRDAASEPGRPAPAVSPSSAHRPALRPGHSMTGQTTRHLADGTTVYSGTVPAGVIARTQGHKEGQSIRVLPFGYVAHDEAAGPAAPLAVRLTVGADGVIRLIGVHWGNNSSAWDYTVAYSGLGHTPAPVAPENATTPQPINTSSPSPQPSQ